ncbi:MAG: hypothetical protein POELPBGB_01548 [Bacteroidia bacterium]|nr:hypothetical protein [Bacteroidia bacterium]
MKGLALSAFLLIGFLLLESCCGNNKPEVSFVADRTVVTVGDTIQFTDMSIQGNGYLIGWSFQGGENLSDNLSHNPSVVYNTPGVYSVSLTYSYKCADETYQEEHTESNYITVNPESTGGGCGGTSTITDIDGNTYNIVQIGDQCWMKENLKTAHFRDGSVIPETENQTSWADIYTSYTQTPAWCYYDEDANNNNVYGKLYNWFAVNDSRGICPDGWHIPDENEIFQLSNFLGGVDEAGGKMKSTGTLWDAPNLGATNSSGFSALPGGSRGYDGIFGGNIGYNASFWSSSPIDSAKAVNFSLSTNDSLLYVGYYSQKAKGLSCRCVKD